MESKIKNMKRLFIGLNPSKKEKLQIAQWRDNHLGVNVKSVKPENFHITLCFIGLVKENLIQNLLLAIEHTAKPKCSITLNELDCWPKPQVLFLKAKNSNIHLEKLAQNIINTTKACGIEQEKRPFIPHLTLSRKAKHVPTISNAIDININFTECHLFESIATDNGVHYKIIHTWPLS